MPSFDQELNSRLDQLRQQGLLRQLRPIQSAQSPHIQVQGQILLNFSSNDYLGLALEPALQEAAAAALQKFGAGAGASRLLCGSLPPHQQLEEALAQFKGTEAALAFSSGYAAALGAIGALLDSNDVIAVDKLVHACIVDAARLCRAKLRVFGHNDLNDVEKILRWADRRHAGDLSGPTTRRPRILVVTESVFSMDGDQAPLRQLVELKDKFGAWLMVDEAHATGLYGKSRRGLAEEHGVAERIEVQMGTLGKALGAAGGFICGSRPLIDYLVNRARPFIFSTAPAPAVAAAATAAVGWVQSPAAEQRRQRLWDNVAAVRECPVLNAGRAGAARRRRPASAILPILIGEETKALEMAERLRQGGVFIPAIRYPTVARGQARLRLTLSAAHDAADIQRLLAALDATVNSTP